MATTYKLRVKEGGEKHKLKKSDSKEFYKFCCGEDCDCHVDLSKAFPDRFENISAGNTVKKMTQKTDGK